MAIEASWEGRGGECGEGGGRKSQQKQLEQKAFSKPCLVLQKFRCAFITLCVVLDSLIKHLSTFLWFRSLRVGRKIGRPDRGLTTDKGMGDIY